LWSQEVGADSVRPSRRRTTLPRTGGIALDQQAKLRDLARLPPVTVQASGMVASAKGDASSGFSRSIAASDITNALSSMGAMTASGAA
jgi:hypothetical protein